MFELEQKSHYIDMTSAMSIKDRQKSLRWLSRQNDNVVYDVFKLQKNHFHRLKSQGASDDLILLSIASLFLSIKEVILSSSMPKRKHRGSDFGFLRQISKNRAKQFRKTRQKRKYEKLLDLQSVICTLVDTERFSTREVSRYLLKHYRFEVSHTSISKFLREIKEVSHD